MWFHMWFQGISADGDFHRISMPGSLPGWKPSMALKIARAICARTLIFGVHGTCLKNQHVAKLTTSMRSDEI